MSRGWICLKRFAGRPSQAVQYCHRFNKLGWTEKAVLREDELVPGSVAAPEQHPADADAGDQHGAVFDRRKVIESVLEHTCELREPATESVYDGK